ncbi:hypothetical protein FA95DRAFT_1578424 [Auriscalpium vulgare]|uniref:Uncharacterized protein n=1 Tax=Auriscalpium vulgare TaxID=40419 RepID=A0ACB8R2F4_9AGAM|nr:hypothetical protein FA95DRAFT_1578424 [Auriscalpium vulgare]
MLHDAEYRRVLKSLPPSSQKQIKAFVVRLAGRKPGRTAPFCNPEHTVAAVDIQYRSMNENVGRYYTVCKEQRHINFLTPPLSDAQHNEIFDMCKSLAEARHVVSSPGRGSRQQRGDKRQVASSPARSRRRRTIPDVLPTEEPVRRTLFPVERPGVPVRTQVLTIAYLAKDEDPVACTLVWNHGSSFRLKDHWKDYEYLDVKPTDKIWVYDSAAELWVHDIMQDVVIEAPDMPELLVWCRDHISPPDVSSLFSAGRGR